MLISCIIPCRKITLYIDIPYHFTFTYAERHSRAVKIKAQLKFREQFNSKAHCNQCNYTKTYHPAGYTERKTVSEVKLLLLYVPVYNYIQLFLSLSLTSCLLVCVLSKPQGKSLFPRLLKCLCGM